MEQYEKYKDSGIDLPGEIPTHHGATAINKAFRHYKPGSVHKLFQSIFSIPRFIFESAFSRS